MASWFRRSVRYSLLPSLCGWALKLLVLKLGGILVYRTALAFFIGLILGEFVLGSFWSLLSLVTGQPMYAFKNW